MKLSPLPLEDDLGDVLEKALLRAGLTIEALAQRSGIAYGRIADAIDYRSELSCAELRQLAGVLGLNEVGFCALGTGKYPAAAIGALPFNVWPLHMPHGIGVANAYLVAQPDSDRAVLFDTGAGIDSLEAAWPTQIRALDAVFLTHIEAEHTGGLCEVVERFGVPPAFIPEGAIARCGQGIRDGETHTFSGLAITAFATPGHAAEHHCYLVRSAAAPTAAALLVSGDLVFAGSVGGAYFSHEQLNTSLRRMLAATPANTVIAPGHGPMTTVENELRFNPFAV